MTCLVWLRGAASRTWRNFQFPPFSNPPVPCRGLEWGRDVQWLFKLIRMKQSKACRSSVAPATCQKLGGLRGPHRTAQDGTFHHCGSSHEMEGPTGWRCSKSLGLQGWPHTSLPASHENLLAVHFRNPPRRPGYRSRSGVAQPLPCSRAPHQGPLS